MTIINPVQAPPSLSIEIDSAGVVEYAAVPTLRFGLRIAGSAPVRAISLAAQVRIDATRRQYDADSQRRLVELFGLPSQWARSMRSLLWTHAGVQVPGFERETVVDLPVTCTYDFDVVASKYLHAVTDGDIPLEFLFSGTVFYAVDGRLQVAHIPWDVEARTRLPAGVWRELMDHYFPRSAWLRLSRDTFDRLYAYKAGQTMATWDEAVEALLRREGGAPWTG